jgi:hypothetical protein
MALRSILAAALAIWHRTLVLAGGSDSPKFNRLSGLGKSNTPRWTGTVRTSDSGERAPRVFSAARALEVVQYQRNSSPPMRRECIRNQLDELSLAIDSCLGKYRR